MEKKLHKIYLIYYTLLIVQCLWQDYYKTLPILFLRDFKRVNVNMETTIKNVKLVVDGRNDLREFKCLYCDKNCQQ